MATTRTTPGRRRHNNVKENIYFEPGKQGRRTGITLKDTGIRDEYGLEPVSGIFSSPVAEPEPTPQRNGNTTLGSDDMVLAESSVPDITETLNLRKTPHLPPKTQTPRHTNIGGSPLRHSSVRPDSRHGSPVRPLSAQPADRANRMLNFQKDRSPVRTSIEKSPSPFKPQPAKSAKVQKTRKSIFNFEAFDDSPVKRREPARESSAEIDRSVQEVQDALDNMVETTIHGAADEYTTVPPSDDHTVRNGETEHHADETVFAQTQHDAKAHPEPLRENTGLVTTMIETEITNSPSTNLTSSNQKRKREHPRLLEESVESSTSRLQLNPDQKRRRSNSGNAVEADPTITEQTFAEPSIEEISYTEHTVEEPSYTEHTVADQTTTDQTMLDHTIADHTILDHTIADHTIFDHTLADQTTVEPTYADETTLEPTYADQTMANESVADETVADQTMAEGHSEAAQTPRSARGRKLFTVQREEDFTAITAANDEEPDRIDDDDESSVEDFVPPPDMDREQEESSKVQPKKRGRKGITGKPKARKPRAATERASSVQSRPAPQRDTESAEIDADGKKKGPRSLVTLRAGTPAEEEGATTTRSGRTSIKPLKYWCNESFVWRHGEVDGVVRAEEVPDAKQPSRRTVKSKRKAGLGAIREDEEEEDEDLLPEAWEDELGVINGRARTWDAELGVGNPDDEVHEDIAFASTSIATRDVQGSAFRYAKVMTMPFFGAGMVEVPPEGYKRTKNSRKMQMIFFVHEGKVTVEVGDIKFGMSKGGVWQVPRGNNYAIYNESKRHPAKIFFAQGCELESGLDENGPA